MSINFSTIQGLTIPKHEIIVPATSESSFGNYNVETEEWDNWGDTLILNAGDTCIITVDGVKYTCTAYEYMSDYGVCLGDGRLQDKADHPEDVPFYAVYFCDRVNGRYIHDISFFYPDSETHTIEIQKVIPSNVIEIKDANGRVIWSANKTVNTLYLRPSADISVGHSLHPADSTSACSLINEELSDLEATYIYSELPSDTGQQTAQSQFELSCNNSPKRGAITSGRIYYYTMTSNASGVIYGANLKIDGIETGWYSLNRVNTENLPEFELDIANWVNSINNYLSINGTLPTISIAIQTRASCSSSKNDGYIGISQIYLELNGEFVV